ncbi:hypothetical protein L3C95_27845 [Chitinophaga filiformis]|uniref:hypothetical protein n=1 Tax=Chitinophaga filiformis TaxID=104663 RepID=UPI001F1EB97E|nr:hypothetical protein [Chitinophaga filiformis]MCF6406742.1 hypothetical protein [Chitinophaga filiformis]
MGYYLNAFIGKSKDISCVCESYNNVTLVNLGQDISLIPLTEDLFDQINELDTAESIRGFEYLTDTIELSILRIIKGKPLAYVEVEYFGGEGGQTGIIWKDGKRNAELTYGQDVVNIVLRSFGVIAERNKDEFDTLGFGRHRNTQDWTKSGKHSPTDG